MDSLPKFYQFPIFVSRPKGLHMIADVELLQWNQQGLIPGPEEQEEDYVKRCHYCLELHANFPTLLSGELPDSIESSKISESLIKEVAPLTRSLFDIVPAWVPIIFSNHRLAPWHGGCAWIFQSTRESPLAAFFQLREAFTHKTRYLGLYDREELLAHESAHIGRMEFQEPKFEELLAYRTAPSFFRRWLGPIIQSSWESVVFIVLLFLSILADFLVLPFDSLWFKLMPIALLVAGLGRVWLRQTQFAACLRNLTNLLGNPDQSNAVAYRLKDQEIIAFGKLRPDQIKEYADRQHCLRWHLLKQAYLKNAAHDAK